MHPNGFGWKSRKTGQVIAITKADLRGLEWLKIPHAYQLKLRAKGGFIYMFNGLKSQVCQSSGARLSSACPSLPTHSACVRAPGQGDSQELLQDGLRPGGQRRQESSGSRAVVRVERRSVRPSMGLVQLCLGAKS